MTPEDPERNDLFVFVIVIFIDSRCDSDEISWGTKLSSVDAVRFIVDGVGVQGSCVVGQCNWLFTLHAVPRGISNTFRSCMLRLTYYVWTNCVTSIWYTRVLLYGLLYGLLHGLFI